MREGITYVGLDVHKKDIVVCMWLPGRRSAEPTFRVVNEPRAVRRLAKRLLREAPGEVECAYEAGPLGYGLQRQLRSLGVGCMVVAPSLIPVKPGDRIKTDRRDARKLVEYLRGGSLTEVHPPSEEDEALRDLCRCREDVREDLTRCRQRLGKFLLRRGVRYGVGTTWTQRHRRWLWGLSFEHVAATETFEAYLLAVEQMEVRLAEVTKNLEELSQLEPYRGPVAWLRCFRGIDTVTAMTIVAELHDFRRFETARQLMAYLGLVPSEHTSADSVRRGPITKTGNSHVRRVLVEAAWHYRHRPAVGKTLRKRRDGQPAAVIAVAEKAQHRLHKRFWYLQMHNNKVPQKATVAVARELAGFIWAVLYPAAHGAQSLQHNA